MHCIGYAFRNYFEKEWKKTKGHADSGKAGESSTPPWMQTTSSNTDVDQASPRATNDSNPYKRHAVQHEIIPYKRKATSHSVENAVNVTLTDTRDEFQALKVMPYQRKSQTVQGSDTRTHQQSCLMTNSSKPYQPRSHATSSDKEGRTLPDFGQQGKDQRQGINARLIQTPVLAIDP